MKRDTENNTITFDNDREFLDWAVIQNNLVTRSDKGTLYIDFDFTPDYEKSVKNGTELIITDPSSEIHKHQAVTFRTVTRPVKVSSPRFRKRS